MSSSLDAQRPAQEFHSNLQKMGQFQLWTTRPGGRNRGIFTGMSFENLSATWPDRPLTDPAVTADVVDLMVSHGDRRRGTLTVLICAPDDHYLATVTVELPADAIPAEAVPPEAVPADRSTHAVGPSPAQLCGTAMHPIIPAVRTAPGTALILTLGRPGPARLTDLDNQWTQAATTICRAAGIRLLGFYIATKDGIYSPDITNTPAAAA